MVQTSVADKQAVGLLGTFYDDSCRRVDTYLLEAVSGATTFDLGTAFTRKNASPEKATAGGSDVFAGVLVGLHEQAIEGLNASVSLTSPRAGELCTKGRVWVKTTTAAQIGYVAAYVIATGAIAAYDKAASVPETAVLIPNATFHTSASANGLAVLELN